MPKKKNRPQDEQPELPLGGDAAAAAQSAPKDGSAKSEAAAPASAPAEPVVSAPAEPPAPRPRAGKVQDEPAPLARSYRNWFLEYASYVIQIGRASCRERVCLGV